MDCEDRFQLGNLVHHGMAQTIPFHRDARLLAGSAAVIIVYATGYYVVPMDCLRGDVLGTPSMAIPFPKSWTCRPQGVCFLDPPLCNTLVLPSASADDRDVHAVCIHKDSCDCACLLSGYADYNFVSDGTTLAAVHDPTRTCLTLFRRQRGSSWVPLRTFRDMSRVLHMTFTTPGLIVRSKMDKCPGEVCEVDMDTLDMRRSWCPWFPGSPWYPFSLWSYALERGESYCLAWMQCSVALVMIRENNMCPVPWEDIVEVRGSFEGTTAIMVRDRALVCMEPDETLKHWTMTMMRPSTLVPFLHAMSMSEARVVWMCAVARRVRFVMT